MNELENNQGSNISGDGNGVACDCTLKSVDDVFSVTYDNIYDLDNDLTVTRSLHNHLSQLYEWRSITEDNKRKIDSLMKNGDSSGATCSCDLTSIYERLDKLEEYYINYPPDFDDDGNIIIYGGSISRTYKEHIQYLYDKVNWLEHLNELENNQNCSCDLTSINESLASLTREDGIIWHSISSIEEQLRNIFDIDIEVGPCENFIYDENGDWEIVNVFYTKTLKEHLIQLYDEIEKVFNAIPQP